MLGWLVDLSSAAASIAACTRLIDSRELVDRNLATVYYNRALAYIGTGDLDAAIRDLGEVITIDPHDATALFNPTSQLVSCNAFLLRCTQHQRVGANAPSIHIAKHSLHNASQQRAVAFNDIATQFEKLFQVLCALLCFSDGQSLAVCQTVS